MENITKREGRKNPRGYFGVGMYQPKTSENIGTLWRSAHLFGASFLFTIGTRCMIRQSSDVANSSKHIPFYLYPDLASFKTPTDCFLVGVEQTDNAFDLFSYDHPVRACYILGAEDYGLPPKVQEYCTGGIVQIQSGRCLNVSSAGSIVMYDRLCKQSTKEKIDEN